jgi:YidC/Oxa1 family membrane protein insertase
MKKSKIIFVLTIVVALSGCTTQLKDVNGKIVKDITTGQTLTSNILCQPTKQETIDLYNSNGVNLSNLPTCQNYSINLGGYDGNMLNYIWERIFVQPLAWLIIKVGTLVKSYGLSLVLTTLFVRLSMVPFTKKSMAQAENMKKAKPDLDALEKKYKDKKDRDEMMQKSQEMMLIYKKYGISPTGGCLTAFIQIPLFFAYYESISRIPVIFEEKFIGFQLGTNPTTAIANGQWYYAIFIILIVIATYYSFNSNPTTAMNSDQEKQMKMMMNYMLVFIFISSIFLPIGIAIYWVTSNLFTIGQNIYIKRGAKHVR